MEWLWKETDLWFLSVAAMFIFIPASNLPDAVVENCKSFSSLTS